MIAGVLFRKEPWLEWSLSHLLQSTDTPPSRTVTDVQEVFAVDLIQSFNYDIWLGMECHILWTLIRSKISWNSFASQLRPWSDCSYSRIPNLLNTLSTRISAIVETCVLKLFTEEIYSIDDPKLYLLIFP